jgi:16S rRNA (cytosine967-C5)-methyltransferase
VKLLVKPSNAGVSPVREIALKLIYDVNEKGAYANLALDKALSASDLSISEKRKVSEIVNGSIRMTKRLDWVLNLFLKQEVGKQHPWVRNILRMAVYQLLMMDKVADYACVNEAVQLTRLKSRQEVLVRVVNGVLRSIIRKKKEIEWPEDPIEYLATYYSHPEWIVELFLDLYGASQVENILKYNNRPAPLVFRNNELLGSRGELIRALEAEETVCSPSINTPWGVNVTRLNNSIANLSSYQQGRFYVQNDASMLAAPILNPQSGERVYDLCAGVGGKTTHLAEYMKNEGNIWAYDIFGPKIDMLQHNCRRMGITIVQPRLQSVLELEPDLPLARRILLDAPCSGLGVLNRRADARFRKDLKDMGQLFGLQSGLLRKAVDLLEPEGLLLYSTCTINPPENQEQILSLLEEGKVVLEGFADSLSFWGLDAEDREQAAQGLLTLLPGKYYTDGMFYALMRRKN